MVHPTEAYFVVAGGFSRIAVGTAGSSRPYRDPQKPPAHASVGCINSVWEFLNEHVTVAFYGVHQDGKTLAAVIDKEAIKLTLTSPEDQRFRQLADGLLSIYRDAQRISNDGRMLAS